MCATLDAAVTDPLSGGTIDIAPSHCDTAASVLTYGLVAGPTVGDSHLAWGVVPDGNSSVVVGLASGGAQVIPVVDNVFEATVPSEATSFTFNAAAGKSVTIP